jgi:membrane fusion protein (multidrug efflux system)
VVLVSAIKFESKTAMYSISRYIFWCMLVLISGVMFLEACERAGRSHQDELGRAVAIRAYTVTVDDIEDAESYPATVVPMSELALRPRLEGRISDVYVREGQQVEQGQRLYGIDRPSHKRAHQDAQERLESARERQSVARRELTAYEGKREEEAGAGQRAVLARSNLEEAISEVNEAEAELEAVSEDLERSLVRAPFSGIIGPSSVEVGSKASPEKPLNVLASAKLIGVDLVVKEAKIGKIERLLDKKPEDSVFMLNFEAGLPYPYPGRIAYIDPTAHQLPGTITVRLVFPNPEERLRLGMRVRVNIFYGDLEDQLVIPEKSVKEEQGNFYVYVIKGDTVERRQVILGARARDLVVVRSGLEEGQRIVLEIKPGLQDGSRVVITSLPKGPERQSANQRPQPVEEP